MIISSYLSHLTVALALCTRDFPWSGCLLLCSTNKKKKLPRESILSFEFFLVASLCALPNYMCFKAVFHWRCVLLAMAWTHASRSIQAPYDQRDFYTAGVLVIYMTSTVILMTLFYDPCKMPGQLQQLYNELVLVLETTSLKCTILSF